MSFCLFDFFFFFCSFFLLFFYVCGQVGWRGGGVACVVSVVCGPSHAPHSSDKGWFYRQIGFVLFGMYFHAYVHVI